MERNKLARQIIDTCLEMTRLGLNQGTAGNVSVRYQDGMLITPTGIPYEKLTESHIVFIDGNGKHEEGKLPFGTRELSEHVALALKNRKATLLQHHGLIACEVNLEKALWLAHEVEVLAQLYLTTLAITDPVPVLSDEEIAVVLEKFKTYGLRIEE